jgi:hypothetical protein
MEGIQKCLMEVCQGSEEEDGKEVAVSCADSVERGTRRPNVTLIYLAIGRSSESPRNGGERREGLGTSSQQRSALLHPETSYDEADTRRHNHGSNHFILSTMSFGIKYASLSISRASARRWR